MSGRARARRRARARFSFATLLQLVGSVELEHDDEHEHAYEHEGSWLSAQLDAFAPTRRFTLWPYFAYGLNFKIIGRDLACEQREYSPPAILT